MTHPPCFPDEASYLDYLDARRESLNGKAVPKCWFCYDCTPGYQEYMQSIGRCDRPDVVFVAYDECGEEVLHGVPLSSVIDFKAD